MKNLLSKTRAVLSRAWVWSLLLLLAAGLLLWFIGPHLAFDDYHPWAGLPARLLTLCALTATWALFIVFSGWSQARRANASRAGDETVETAVQTPEPDHQALRAGFKRAQKTLSRTRLYRGRSERWRKALPWYLLLGPQGSGKTSLLDYSGLNLPLNPRENKASLPPAPTADCDWYFAEQGVLLDTSGRYLTQRDAASSSGWKTLLKLISRQRRNKPLNGVLVNLPVGLLLADDQKPLTDLADQIRERLQDIHQQLHSQSRVYLVLSKADEIRGFDCFYQDLGLEQRQQVLGVSVGDTTRIDAPLVEQKFAELLNHISSQVVERTRRERQPRRVAQLLDFPRQLTKIVEPLAGFVDQAFSGNRYQPAHALRGVYLTSAPHLVEEKPAANTSSADNKPSKMQGQPRFIHDLLGQVVFAEAGLAALDRKEIRRIRWQQLALCTAALSCLGVFAALWAKGFTQNDQRLLHLTQMGEQLARDRLTLGAQDDAFAILPQLESSHGALQIFAAQPVDPLTRLMTLDQANATQPVLLNAYRYTLENQLLPRIARQLENQLRADLNNRDELLDSLRAYLMLDDLQHRDVAFLRKRITADWRSRYAGTSGHQQKLDSHLSRLLERPVKSSLNAALIEQARQALRSAPVAELAYLTLKEKTRSLPGYHLNRLADPHGVLFSATDHVIPGFYTQKSYQRYFLAQGLSLLQESLNDDWVMGVNAVRNPGDIKALMVELEQLYLRDYADHWSQAIGQLTLQPLSSAVQGAEQAAMLTAANFPLVKLLTQIRENTRFDTPKVPVDAPKASNVAASIADQARAALIDQLPNNAKIALQRRFEAIHQLLDDEDNPGLELAATLQALNSLQQQLAAVARSSQPEQAAFELAKARMGGQLDAINMLRASSVRLPPPFNGSLGKLADDSWRLLLDDAYRYISQRYQSELYSVYSEAIAKRYPFDANSASDVAITDFREFFKAQGVAGRFFEDYLKPFIKGESRHYKLRSVDGRSLPMSLNTLNQMRRVQMIRRSFFAENPELPLIKFRLEPYSLDQNLSRADFQFGNTQLEYRHGPIVPLVLQWPDEADNGIASLIVEHPTGRRVGYQENTGPWSLFRLIERLDSEFHSGRDVLMLKANIEGRRVNYLLMSQRSPNPFELGELRGFRLPAVL
ncbi:type VI secretion system membrane subunit TssM [Pseudomonas syringae]|uniref:Type VI secretion system membrane subunit TssM n=1 Tax=Pseudomonas syringae TaxID=317 RepID=A0A085V006_PSESX|nr:type VI secretion system membrane subunit TssM [Pseudomonas syringae]KFE48769.1 hypothetical protein IV02_21240 [Pseudomonas syringae]